MGQQNLFGPDPYLDGKLKWCSQCRRSLRVGLFSLDRYGEGRSFLRHMCNGCRRNQRRPKEKEYRERNRAAINLRVRHRYAEERDYRERTIVYHRKWKAENPEKTKSIYRKSSAAWRKRNPWCHYIAYWKNPEKARIDGRRKQHRRYSLLKGGPVFSVDEWYELCEIYGDRCAACGKRAKLTVDHIIPVSKGGASTISNIQPLCQPCNSSKGTKSDAVWRKLIAARKAG